MSLPMTSGGIGARQLTLYCAATVNTVRSLLQVERSASMLLGEFENAAAAARHAGERVIGDDHGEPGLLGDQFVDVAQQRSPAREHDAALRHIAAEVGGRLLQ